MKAAALLLPLLLAGCGVAVTTDPVAEAKAQTRLGQLLAGRIEVGTRQCIPARPIDRQTIIDDRAIFFRQGSNRLYRSSIADCPKLGPRSQIIRRTTGTSICRGEIFEVRDAGTGFSYGACTFGDFTEYRGSRRR